MIRNLYSEEWKDIQFDEVISLEKSLKFLTTGGLLSAGAVKNSLKRNHTLIFMRLFL